MFQMVNSQGIYPYKEAIGPEEISKLYENQFSSNYFKNYYGAILFN